MIRNGNLVCDRCGAPDPHWRDRERAPGGEPPPVYCDACVKRAGDVAEGEATVALELLHEAIAKARRAGMLDGEIEGAFRRFVGAEDPPMMWDSDALEALPTEPLWQRSYLRYENEGA